MLGVIGGSGLYDLPDLTEREELEPETPFGRASAPIVIGRLHESSVAFLARHGRGHEFGPTDLPYRANVYAMRSVGVTHLLAVSAVGSLRESIPPRHAVIPDQIIDRTVQRSHTFFDRGVVAHVGLADPFCQDFRASLFEHAVRAHGKVDGEGTYVCIEGPQFSTRAESHLYRSWGASVIGMTAMPEARLAREAGLCYALLALVTDYDVWHESEGDVTVEMVQRVLRDNIETGRSVIRRIAETGLPGCSQRCRNALDGAIITERERLSQSAAELVAFFSTAPGGA